MSLKVFISANLFRDVLDASGFHQNHFLDLLLERIEEGRLDRRWRHVKVASVSPGTF